MKQTDSAATGNLDLDRRQFLVIAEACLERAAESSGAGRVVVAWE